ncbi:hypothetical protein HUU62_03645 [Rhodoferax sp. 4810]|uniref:Uncharacterized protein n=1 Tax=Thiospirillum jenense TaxID=1653858 RepID=A0A839HCW9_9GAMM|nr:hypothetical protein [Thiospirillum jenense]MBB1073502.1 hypothetical protein [Rhodoferax jenense]MBB1125990.1 hypothetical protein [Thiospirillum jenense]
MKNSRKIADFFRHIYCGRPPVIACLCSETNDYYYSWQRMINWKEKDLHLFEFIIFLENIEVDVDFFIWSQNLVSFLDTLRNQVLFYVLYSRCWHGDRNLVCDKFPSWLPDDLLITFANWSKRHVRDEEVLFITKTWYKQFEFSEVFFFKNVEFGALTEYQMLQELFSNPEIFLQNE